MLQQMAEQVPQLQGHLIIFALIGVSFVLFLRKTAKLAQHGDDLRNQGL